MHRSHGIQHLRHKRSTFAFMRESGYTLGFRRRIAHKGLHGETGGISDGGAVTTLRLFHTFANLPGPGIRTANFAALGAWSRVLPKNTESLRNSDVLMRVAVPQASRPRWAACFFVSVEISICTSCVQWFPRVRDMGGITTLDVLCVLLKCRTAACQKGSFAVF